MSRARSRSPKSRAALSLIQKVTRNQYPVIQVKRFLGKKIFVPHRDINASKDAVVAAMAAAATRLKTVGTTHILHLTGILKSDGTVELVGDALETICMISLVSYDDIKKKNLAWVVHVKQYSGLTSEERALVCKK
jgi:hypothetical protein